MTVPLLAVAAASLLLAPRYRQRQIQQPTIDTRRTPAMTNVHHVMTSASSVLSEKAASDVVVGIIDAVVDTVVVGDDVCTDTLAA